MCVKVSHKTKGKAEKAAYAIKAKGRIPARAELNAYYCKVCNAWHLTKLTPIQYFNKLK